MKNLFPLALALTTSAAYAQNTPPTSPAQPPVATEVTPALVPNPGLDPAATALLDQSAKAYAALSGVSMHFTASDQTEGKTDVSSGDIVIEKPNKARLQFKVKNRSVLFLSDGTKLTMQTRPEEYLSKPVQSPDIIPTILQSIPSALGLVFPPLASGESPLVITQIQWQKAVLLPDNGVALTVNAGPANPPALFRLYFNATDHLLRRVEAELTLKGKKNLNITTLTDVRINPTLTPDAFTFIPAEGVNLVANPTPYNPALKVGAVPTGLVGRDLKGFAHPWSQYQGKVVLLHFWATWAARSTADIPDISRNLKKYQAQGFRALGVSLDNEKAALQSFLAAKKVSYPQIFDGRGPQTADAQNYQLQALPFSLLIGKDGKIAAVNAHGAALDKAIQQALQAK